MCTNLANELGHHLAGASKFQEIHADLRPEEKLAKVLMRVADQVNNHGDDWGSGYRLNKNPHIYIYIYIDSNTYILWLLLLLLLLLLFIIIIVIVIIIIYYY